MSRITFFQIAAHLFRGRLFVASETPIFLYV